MKMEKKQLNILVALIYFIFVTGSFIAGFLPGKEVGYNFLSFSIEMIKILPCAFVLIGLFEVWVKKEHVERHLGKDAGIMSFIWVILLAGTTIGGLYIAFPVAYSMFKKGARLSVIFAYIGAAAICRIPMTLFEASFMGIKFTVIRLVVSIPLVILSAVLLGNFLEKRGYQVLDGK